MKLQRCRVKFSERGPEFQAVALVKSFDGLPMLVIRSDPLEVIDTWFAIWLESGPLAYLDSEYI